MSWCLGNRISSFCFPDLSCSLRLRYRTENVSIHAVLFLEQKGNLCCVSGEVLQTRPVLFRRAPIARSVTQKPFSHLSLALFAHSGQVWRSVVPIGAPRVWKLSRAEPPQCVKNLQTKRYLLNHGSHSSERQESQRADGAFAVKTKDKWEGHKLFCFRLIISCARTICSSDAKLDEVALWLPSKAIKYKYEQLSPRMSRDCHVNFCSRFCHNDLCGHILPFELYRAAVASSLFCLCDSEG